MARKKTLQAAFEAFDDQIRLPRLDEDGDGQARLRAIRDETVESLRDGLVAIYKDTDEARPTFEVRNQGSYAIGTGTRPIGGRDYDIDVALMMNLSHEDKRWSDPTTLKQKLLEALEHEGGTATQPGFMRPCLRVDYPDDNVHVDLAVYATQQGVRLARGFVGSSEVNKEWTRADPMGLVEHLSNTPLGYDDRRQYFRVVRLWKRWKDLKFSDRGQAAPPGVGLTALARHLFIAKKNWGDGSYDDLRALYSVVSDTVARFYRAWDAEREVHYEKLEFALPSPPYNDIFERMSSRQMQGFYDKLVAFRDALKAAIDATDPADAASILRTRCFDEFPEVDSAAKVHVPPVIHTSESG